MFHRGRALVGVFLREALRGLRRNPTRSALTTLGITIGVSAVVLAVAIGSAGARRVQSELQKLGENLVWIEAGSRNAAGVRTGTRGATTLTLDDAEAIVREIPLIAQVSPQVDGNVQVLGPANNWSTRFRGGSPEYLSIRRWEVARGTNFSREDVEQAAPKVLLGETVRQQLFGAGLPLGETVRMRGQPFEVIGVLAAKGQSAEGRDQDDWIFLPHTTAQKRLRGRNVTWLDDIFCSAVSPQAVDGAIERVVALLRQRHRIEPGMEDDFNIRRPDELLRAQAEASRTMTLLLVAVASISLLVGGIGIMNVMLASVAQRTREIGLRMAVGATEWSVRLQFLSEAAVLCLVGAAFGLGLAWAASSIFSSALGWAVAIPPSAPAVAVGSAVAVGILSGLWPAWSASRLDPIEALRHE